MAIDSLILFFGLFAMIYVGMDHIRKVLMGESRSVEVNKTKQNKIIDKQIDNTTVIILYILSFFIPLAGFIVGAIYASKDEEHYKHVGKNCLIFSVTNIVLGVVTVAILLDYYVV